jgi:hypothetical protein
MQSGRWGDFKVRSLDTQVIVLSWSQAQEMGPEPDNAGEGIVSAVQNFIALHALFFNLLNNKKLASVRNESKPQHFALFLMFRSKRCIKLNSIT